MADRTAIGIREDRYDVRWRVTEGELGQVFRLRADVFCRELRWIGSGDSERERDEIDDHAVHLAVLGDFEALATVRLTPARAPWMFDGVFRHLLPAGVPIENRQQSMEASRLAVAKHARHVRLGNGARMSDLMYKAAYVFCRMNGVRYLYIVTSDVVLRHMRAVGLPCVPLAPPMLMENCVRTVPAVIDWWAIDKSTALYRWYDSVTPVAPCSLPSPLHETRSPRRASL
jgi:N-acyl-L-homoserine lactone synthetase